MKIKVTFDLDDDTRRAINHRFGQPGMADRATCESVMESLLRADLDEIRNDWENASEFEPEGEQPK